MKIARAWVGVCLGTFVMVGGAAGQELADYDYENLSLRGVTVEGGYLWADNVEDTESIGIKFDLGYLGPGFRLVTGVTYWDSRMAREELARWESRLSSLNSTQGGAAPPGGFDLGIVDREDIQLSLDGHYVWRIPANLFFYTGLGFSAHILNGSGPAVDGTFVEDLLDSVAAGVNLHAGLEYATTDRLRLFTNSRVEVLGDLKYLEIRGGLSFIFGGLVSGEAR